MKSEWYVQCNPIGGEYKYISTRTIDTSKVVHSGNIEHYGNYSADRAEIEEIVNKLNETENLI